MKGVIFFWYKFFFKTFFSGTGKYVKFGLGLVFHLQGTFFMYLRSTITYM